MEANIVVMGTESVGKSGETRVLLPQTHGVTAYFLSHKVCFAALTVRLLTRRFIGEYGDIGNF